MSAGINRERSDRPRSEAPDARRALSGGADAVVLVAFGAAGVRVEFANEAAQTLLGIDAAPGAAPFDETRVPELAPLFARLRDGTRRERTTREHVVLPDIGGGRLVVDVQVEPLPTPGDRRVLAVVRLAEQEMPTQAAPPGAGVFRTELGLGAVFVDDALLGLLGLSHEQALGLGWLDALHPDDRAAVASAFESADAPDDAVQLECRIVRGAGSERIVRIRAVPVRGDDGALTGYLASLEDLTEEQRDREAGTRLAELADVLHEWIAIASADCRLRYANPAARNGLALWDDDVTVLHLADLIEPEQLDATLGAMSAALDNGGAAWTGDLALVARDGRRVDIECTIVAHRAPDGSIAHYSLLGRDVSTLRAVERELQESEERFRLLSDASPSGVYLVVDHAVLNYANQRLAEIMGRPVSELLGQSFLEWVHPDDLARVRESAALMSARHHEIGIEFRIVRPSGEVRWLRARAAPVTAAGGELRAYVGSIVDITHELASRRDLQMIGRALEATRDLVSFHDAAGRMFFANAATREFLGISGPIPPLVPFDYVESGDVLLPEIARTLLEQSEWTGELVFRAPDGTRMPVSTGVIAHRDALGNVEYFSSLSRDLSEQKSSEAARRRSEAVLRAIVQASPLSIFALDADGNIHVWNRASEELFGWTASEVVGGPPPFADDESAADLGALIGRVFAGHTVKGHRVRYHRRDGSALDAEIAIAPLGSQDDRVVSAVAVLADVTEQTRATQALVESEVWFRSLVQHSTDMVIVIGHDASVLYLSPTAREFSGVDGDDVRGRAGSEIFPALDEDVEELQRLFAEVYASPGASVRMRARVWRADGVVRWIEMVATNLLDDPAVRGVVINGRDVTEGYEADAALRSSEERLRMLLSSVSDAITVLDRNGVLTYWSPVADQMFAALEDEDEVFETESVFSLLDIENTPRAMKLWEQTLETPGISPPAEIRIRMPDGSSIDAEIVANNLLDDAAVEGIVMTVRNITDRKRSERALRDSESRLRDSEARYRAVVDDQIELVCRYLPDTTITFANRAFAEFYGRRLEDLIGSPLIDLYPAIERAAEMERLARFGRGAEVNTYEDWELAADGVRRWYRWTDRAFLDPEGRVVEFQSVGHDVTEERRATVLTMNQADILEQIARGVPLEETLRAITTTVEAHFPKISCAVFRLDDAATTLHLGAASHLPRRFATELDGIAVSENCGSAAAAVMHREPVYVADATVDPFWSELHSLAVEHDIRAAWSTPILASDGRTVLGTVDGYAKERGEPDSEHRRIFSLVAHLASIAIERKEFENRLAHESMHDPLTGLPNRLLFLDRLSLAVARGQRTHGGVAVLFLDLDRFKNVNDSLGHDAGDELLIAVARRLEAMLRPGDTVARFGGDEFTILCEDLPPASARGRAVEIAQRLLEAVGQPFVVRNSETFVGVSIGIALTATGEESPDELLRDADAAMYHAKDVGRGRVEVFDDTMRARALARHATENALHHAIERGELRLFFQPIVRLGDARCIGAEALVRWQHPERGLVLPHEFVPLAEETGLIMPLGSWVLEQSCIQAARWQLEQDEDFVVSVNLSARQVAEADLAERVTDVIERTGVRPSNICFEITETVLMQDADAVMRIIERVRALGVRFAIDDFGTGYSSLGYLKRFSVDTVKIDRAFVDGLADDQGDRAIVSAVIGLAHALGLRVVAEGVEREAQLIELVALGCDEAQGYFFAPPQPPDDLRALVSRTRRWRPPGAPLMDRP